MHASLQRQILDEYTGFFQNRRFLYTISQTNVGNDRQDIAPTYPNGHQRYENQAPLDPGVIVDGPILAGTYEFWLKHFRALHAKI